MMTRKRGFEKLGVLLAFALLVTSVSIVPTASVGGPRSVELGASGAVIGGVPAGYGSLSGVSMMESTPLPTIDQAKVQAAAAVDPDSVEMTPELEAFRAEYAEYLKGMQKVSALLAEMPGGPAAAGDTRLQAEVVLVPGIDADEIVAGLTPFELSVMHSAYSQVSGWQRAPQMLASSLQSASASGPSASGPSAQWYPYAPVPGDNPWGWYWARLAEIAAEVVWNSLPADTWTFLGRVAAGIPYSIAAGAVATFERIDMEEDNWNWNFLQEHLHNDEAYMSSTVVPLISSRSSQASLDAHDAALTAARNALDAHLLAQDTSLTVEAQALHAHLYGQDATAAAMWSALDTHMTAQDTAIANALAVLEAHLASQDATLAAMWSALEARLDAQDAYMADTRAYEERMQIEDALQAGEHVGLFQRPAVAGGRLEIVRDVVTDTIAGLRAAGQPVYNAELELSRGNTAFARREYKKAYEHYIAAYQEAVR